MFTTLRWQSWDLHPNRGQRPGAYLPCYATTWQSCFDSYCVFWSRFECLHFADEETIIKRPSTGWRWDTSMDSSDVRVHVLLYLASYVLCFFFILHHYAFCFMSLGQVVTCLATFHRILRPGEGLCFLQRFSRDPLSYLGNCQPQVVVFWLQPSLMQSFIHPSVILSISDMLFYVEPLRILMGSRHHDSHCGYRDN